MKFQFNPFTGNFDAGVDDPLTLSGLTVTGTATLQHIHGNIAGTVYIHVKNTSGIQLQKGTPVRVVGAVGDTTTLEVAAADSSSPQTMPAIAVLSETLAVNATGHAAVGGELTGLATGSYSIGQALYVAAGGGLTGTRPTNGTIQQVAIVGRVHVSTGSLTVAVGSSEAALLSSRTLSNSELTGSSYVNGSYRSNNVEMAALDIDCSLGNYFSKAISSDSTFTFSNAPASSAYSFVLRLTHTSGIVTWPSSVFWSKNTAPILTVGKTHLFTFLTDDGGSTWHGAALVDYID